MNRFAKSFLFIGLIAVWLVNNSASVLAAKPDLWMVVMDPLAAPLACDCVEGYAQRDYAALAEDLRTQTGRTVGVVWNESLAEALKQTDGRADIVIGKRSVVLADLSDARPGGFVSEAVQAFDLTGKAGSVTQHGLLVVRAGNPARELSDLGGYEILFGPKVAEEKSSAAVAALAAAGVEISGPVKRFGACSEAAMQLIDADDQATVAAVISSYAEPLLRGCGSIKAGDLRVVGRTADVPFITAVVSGGLDKATRDDLAAAFLTVSTRPPTLAKLESLVGFLPATLRVKALKKNAPAKPLLSRR